MVPATVKWALGADIVVGVVAVLIAGLVSGGPMAASLAVGFALVIGFLALSAWAVLAAERISVHMTLPVALTVYLTGLLFLALIVSVVGNGQVVRRVPVGFAVLAAVLVWLIVQLIATIKLDEAPSFRARRRN